eukprot:286914-Pleurochrysis_carterae.AAC.2
MAIAPAGRVCSTPASAARPSLVGATLAGNLRRPPCVLCLPRPTCGCGYAGWPGGARPPVSPPSRPPCCASTRKPTACCAPDRPPRASMV